MKTVLIIAQSGQMLAQAAVNIGLNVFVIDCFADQDTQALATDLVQVTSLTIQSIYPAIKRFKKNCYFCLYGSGFEAYPESLELLEQHFQVLGSSAKILRALQNKPLFFQGLQQLNIPYPEVFFKQPPPHKTYLIKPFASLGGDNIRFVSPVEKKMPANASFYYQQYLKGEALSMLFVGDGTQAHVIGYQRQWTCPHSFLFSGIMTQPNLKERHKKKLFHWVNQLTLHYHLLGLCSLDFMLYEDRCYVLEINARPPASMALYDSRLLKIHLTACQSKLITAPLFSQKAYWAYQIIYARRKIHFLKSLHWEKCYRDLPPLGRIILPNYPICSMIMSGNNPDSLLDNLQAKQESLFKQLNRIP
jgi:predicted ATP-grasp superfamily ATP-dependent carboligase